jgi:hypothetical protein
MWVTGERRRVVTITKVVRAFILRYFLWYVTENVTGKHCFNKVACRPVISRSRSMYSEFNQ